MSPSPTTPGRGSNNNNTPSRARAPSSSSSRKSDGPSTPYRSGGNRSASQTQMYSQSTSTPGISNTPIEIMGTPRTPHHLSRGNDGGTPFSQRTSTPSGALPRGDVGRGVRVPSFNNSNNNSSSNNGSNSRSSMNAPPTPSTPLGFDLGGTPASHSHMGTPSASASMFSMSPHRGLGNLGTPSGPGGGDDGPGGAGGGPPGGDDEEDRHDIGDGMRIWGTTINVDQCYRYFRNFLRQYTLEDDFEPYYLRQLEILHRVNRHVLNLNCSHLCDFPAARVLYQQLVEFPQEVIPILDLVVNDIMNAEYRGLEEGEAQEQGRKAVQVRTFNLVGNLSRMRDLDPKNIDQLLSIKGMVIRCSPIIPDLKMAFFRCFVCQYDKDIMINMGRIDEPTKCDNCNVIGCMELIHNRCAYTDKQLIRLQETSDEIPQGETPYTVTLFAFDDLVDAVRPGDRLEVTGVYRAVPTRVNPKIRTVRSIYKTYIDVIHFRRSELAVQDGSGSGTGGRAAGGKSKLDIVRYMDIYLYMDIASSYVLVW